MAHGFVDPQKLQRFDLRTCWNDGDVGVALRQPGDRAIERLERRAPFDVGEFGYPPKPLDAAPHEDAVLSLRVVGGGVGREQNKRLARGRIGVKRRSEREPRGFPEHKPSMASSDAF